jgi:hypothetical protein
MTVRRAKIACIKIMTCINMAYRFTLDNRDTGRRVRRLPTWRGMHRDRRDRRRDSDDR